MAFASGPVTFQRFEISGPLPEDVTDELVAALNGRSFGQAPPLSDDTQIGWIGPQHVLQTQLSAETIAFGRFAHLAMRMDRLKPPANVVKAYIRMEEEAALQSSGREQLSRGEKRQARDAALSRADAEARSGEFRRITTMPVLFDLQHKRLYLGSLSPTAADKLRVLVHETFGCNLEAIEPEMLAGQCLTAHNNARALESLVPFTLVEPPEGFGGAGADFAGTDLNFLGKEFLTWLWHQIDTQSGALQVRDGQDIVVMIDKTMRLKCDFGLTGTDVITADGPASLPEARAALKVGKQPNKLGLVVGSPLGEFRLSLDGPRLAISSLALPEPDTEQDERARLEHRFELAADAANIIDALFEVFVLERTGRDWDTLLQQMSAWAKGGRRPKLHAQSA
jgi:hypothetical protein